MGIGLIVIGDEILSGKRRDKHLARTIELLGERGLELAWCRYVGDDGELLTRTLMETMASGDIVFSCGGIGATPDDRTRQCAARAEGVALVRHPEAVAELEAQFGTEAYPHRILMAELPENARLIPNPVNRVPGFSLGDHHFLPGFPQMAWPMLEWVLDNRYPHLHRDSPVVEQALWVLDTSESALLPVMESLIAAHPDTRFYSLPHIAPDGRRHIELGLRGEAAAVSTAMAHLRAGLATAGVVCHDALPPDRRHDATG